MRRVLSAVLTTFLTTGVLLAGPPASAAPAAAAEPDPTASTYTSLSPVRVLDTRTGTGPVGAGGTITLDLASRVPATATSVVLNVTGVSPTAATHVIIFPGGTTRPTASSLNLAPGDTRPNQVTVTLGANRTVSLYNNAGTVHLVADLAGYYGTGGGAKFTALPPHRILDTRTGGTLGPGGTYSLDLTNRVPASATAVTFNLTGTGPTAATFVTAFPSGTARPTASNLNLPPGDTRANLVTVAIGADRRVNLFNNAGSVDLVADLTGFYTPDYGAYFVPRSPSRVLDTRNGTGAGKTSPAAPGEIVGLDLAGLPLTATGVVLNVTGVDATASTYVAAWGRYENQTAGSNLNLSAGQTVPNAAVVAFGRARGVQLFNNAGNLHLIADLAGVFAVYEPACTVDCVYAWGENSRRKLGTAQAVFDSATPTQVVGLSGVRAVDGAGMRNGYALRTDGTVRAWGDNDFGQLGNGWTSNSTGGGSPVPVPVLGLTQVTAVASGGLSAIALRADGTVWSWGYGAYGALGNGGTASTSVPVQVSGLTGVTAIAHTAATAYALRSDGTVWAWGYNAFGALGNGTSTTQSAVPVRVTGLTGVTAVAGGGDGAYALRSDGTVWAWGRNDAGQLGNGQTCAPNQSEPPCESRVPVPVSGLTNVTAVAGGLYNGYAIRTDGTVWAWGAGTNGALGSGVDCGAVEWPCAAVEPVRVSGVDDATAVASFEYGGYALRADGSVAAWGFNGYGSLANGSAYWESLVPVPALGLGEVGAIGAGEYSGYAVVA